MNDGKITDGPMTDESGILLRLLAALPDPVRNLYRTYTPDWIRKAFRTFYPYEQDFARSILFWANPKGRRRQKAELQRCENLEEYFAFATTYFGHQQWKQEIIGLLSFVAKQKPIRICEVGLFTGGTNLMLSHALPTVQLIIGVDVHVRNKSQLRYFAKPSHRQFFIAGKSCDTVTLDKVAQALDGDKLDLLFIDADHSYAGVKQDFFNYKQFVREGGIVVFHDIVQDHLTRFKHDPKLWKGAQSGEVYLFWQRIKPYYKDSQEFVVDYAQDGCGIGALIYSSKVDVPADL